MVFLFREKIKIKLTTCRGFYHIDGTLGFNSTPGSSEPYSSIQDVQFSQITTNYWLIPHNCSLEFPCCLLEAPFFFDFDGNHHVCCLISVFFPLKSLLLLLESLVCWFKSPLLLLQITHFPDLKAHDFRPLRNRW